MDEDGYYDNVDEEDVKGDNVDENGNYNVNEDDNNDNSAVRGESSRLRWSSMENTVNCGPGEWDRVREQLWENGRGW